MKTMPSIQKYMTAMPHTIGGDLPLKKALSMMREHSIRHLPVQTGGDLVGILSDRDVKLASSFSDAEKLTVEDVMSPDPYTVSVDATIDHVAFEMAEHKYGCAVIMQANKKVVGIFTATDGLRVLGEILQKNYNARRE